MKTIKQIIVLLFAVTIHSTVVAQVSVDEQLALQYYENKEYDKALDYYEKLYYKASPQLYYEKYLSCLLQTNSTAKAEKLVKKWIKQHPDKLMYRVDLGMVYLYDKEPKKAESAWEKAIGEVKSDEQAMALAKSFLEIKQPDLAIKTYQRGRKVSDNRYPYYFELAEAYKLKGDKQSMIREYLNALELQEAYIGAVQGGLQTTFGDDADAEQNQLLKTELVKRIQQHPDKTVFSELLIWMQLQQKDFNGALLQAKALDKRKKERGERIMALAQLFVQNAEYDLAAGAYEYVIEKGKLNYYYVNARMEWLKVKYQKVVLENKYTLEELQGLETGFLLAIGEFGRTSDTYPLFEHLAHLQAFYLHNTNDAILLLTDVVDKPVFSEQVKAELKLELADILLLSGDIWEASLRYSQVEKAFKYDEIGQEAKFRNAKVAYYTHDFKWAQAQLDVLKGATSKLIANDAMELSLTISDAIAIDTVEEPLVLFANADLLMFQNKDSLALLTYDSVSLLYPSHSLSDDVLFRKAQIALKHHQFNDAAVFYESILSGFAFGVLGDDTLFNLAELNEKEFNNPEKAKELYQRLLEEYPGSLYVVDARKRFRILRGDAIN